MISPALGGGNAYYAISRGATILKFRTRVRTCCGAVPMHSYTSLMLQRVETRMNSLIHVMM